MDGNEKSTGTGGRTYVPWMNMAMRGQRSNLGESIGVDQLMMGAGGGGVTRPGDGGGCLPRAVRLADERRSLYGRRICKSTETPGTPVGYASHSPRGGVPLGCPVHTRRAARQAQELAW